MHGYGDFSPSVTLKASTLPAQMSTLTVEKDSTDATKVKITWLIPDSNGEDLIDFEIYIKEKDGAFS